MPNDSLIGSIVDVKADESQSISNNLSEVESITGQLSSSLELTGSIQLDSDHEEMSLIGSVSDDNTLAGEIDDPSSLNGDVSPSEIELSGDLSKPWVTNDYNELINIPSIEGVPVKGELTSDDLGLQRLMSEISTTEIIQMWNKIMNE